MESLFISAVWAKSETETVVREAGEARYHPLALHLADVAATVSELWESILSPGQRQFFCRSFATSDDRAVSWFKYLASLHDIGKCTPEFQRANIALAAPLIRLGLLSDAKTGRQGRTLHGLMGAVIIAAHLQNEFHLPKITAHRWASVAGGHHGVFPDAHSMRNLRLPTESHILGSGPWEELRAIFLKKLSTWLHPTPPPEGGASQPGLVAAAGLLSVADWIASNQKYFPCAARVGEPQPPLDLESYGEEASARARRALKELGWVRIPSAVLPNSFTHLFPGKTPRSSQLAIQDLAQELKSPAAILIEAPMGEGKTESALQLADRFGALGNRGFYFGLPTQATSNQLFGRILTFLASRYPGQGAIPSMLAHGHALLSPEFLDLLEKGATFAEISSIGDFSDDAIFASSWFLQNKRALLVPFGVGTVDQALMASLITKHGFVRLFGLTGKVVIIDEVHAYDAYMSTLLERLLEWLGALGCPVILLSATLPVDRRDALMKAWAVGAGGGAAAQITVADERYPRVTMIASSGESWARQLPVSARSQRRIHLSFTPRDELCEAVLSLIADGGCAAVLCNTVAQAQRTFEDLQAACGNTAPDLRPELELFHARFVVEERQAIEQRIFSRYGPQSEHRPRRSILVATQVVEQSLDLDFDVMFSELAPVDLLLQRSGRLHRHERDGRPAALAEPHFRIVAPKVNDELPEFGRGNTSVYERYVLLKSWLALKDRKTIELPGDVEPLIENVYGSGSLELLPTALDRSLQGAKLEMDRHRSKCETEARNRYLPKPLTERQLEDFTRNPLDEDNPTVHPRLQAVTRLSDPSVQAICLFGEAEAATLDAAGLRPIDLRAPLIPSTVTALLNRSLSITNRVLFSILIEEEAPQPWRKSGLLRFCKPIYLDQSGRAELGDCLVELHPQLGLRIRRRET